MANTTFPALSSLPPGDPFAATTPLSPPFTSTNDVRVLRVRSVVTPLVSLNSTDCSSVFECIGAVAEPVTVAADILPPLGRTGGAAHRPAGAVDLPVITTPSCREGARTRASAALPC